MLCHFDFQLCNLLIGHIGKRQAAVAAVEAHQVQCLLYRDWVDVHEQCVHEVEILKRECLRRLEVARNGSGGKLVHFFRHDVGERRDDALAAERQQGDHLVVVAARSSPQSSRVLMSAEMSWFASFVATMFCVFESS